MLVVQLSVGREKLLYLYLSTKHTSERNVKLPKYVKFAI